MLIVEDIVGVVVSPVTFKLSAADQLKVLGWLAVNPKFNVPPEHKELLEFDVMEVGGITDIAIVWIFPTQLPVIDVGVML